MNRHLSRTAACGVFLVVVLSAGPAWGHAVFPTKVYPADSVQRIVMDVPHERTPDDFNVGVDVAIPSGWNVTGCEAAAPWQCRIEGAGPQVVRWSKDPAAGANPNDETFVFTARTGPPGNHAFSTNQTYNTGEEINWVGPPGSDEPAAVLKTEGAAGSSATTTPGASTDESSEESSNTGVIIAGVAAVAVIGLGALLWASARRRGRAGQPPADSPS